MQKKTPWIILAIVLAVFVSVLIGVSTREGLSDRESASAGYEVSDREWAGPEKLDRSDRDRLEELFSLTADDTEPWQTRVESVREIGSLYESLSEDDLDRLYELMRRHPEGRPEDWYVVANEIMNVLRDSELDRGTYTDQLLDILVDSDLPEVTRDYAIQHLALWLVERGPESDLNAEVFPEAEELKRHDAVFNEILTFLKSPETLSLDLVGTGLTALQLAYEQGQFESPLVIESEFQEFVLGIASGAVKAPLATRMAALQSAAEMTLPETASLSRDILTGVDAAGNFTPTEAAEALSSEASGVSLADLHLSAVAALGISGDLSDIPRLQAMSEETSHLTYAAKAAIRRINQSIE